MAAFAAYIGLYMALNYMRIMQAGGGGGQGNRDIGLVSLRQRNHVIMHCMRFARRGGSRLTRRPPSASHSSQPGCFIARPFGNGPRPRPPGTQATG